MRKKWAPAAQMRVSSDGSMANMAGMDMSGMHMAPALLAPTFSSWSLSHLAFMFAMWVVMMVGMMTPSVTPMVLLYGRLMGGDVSGAQLMKPVAWFLMGYLLAWTAFSIEAVLAQWLLESLALMSPAMSVASPRIGGLALIITGIYQWLPVKDACLAQCRAPLQFVQQHGGFQASARGSLKLGFLHGYFCIGCCWALMLLLFVVGIMNLLWIAALMVYVLIEKSLPAGRTLARAAGAGAIITGIWMAV
jgi:predicted metal-binding membrane protein